MTKRQEYEVDHRTAKVVVCAIVIGLLLLDNRLTDILAVVVWFFCVNPIQYCIEFVMKHKHKVKWW